MVESVDICFLNSVNAISPPASAASSASFHARTWLDDAFKRVVELLNTFAPMSDTIRIAHSAQIKTLPDSSKVFLVCIFLLIYGVGLGVGGARLRFLR